jgi:uncharacterized membrane protein
MFTNGKHFSQWAAIAVATILLSAWEAQAQKPPKPSDGSKLSFTTYDLHPGSPYLKSEARGLNDFGVAVGLAGAWDLYDETDWTRAMCWSLSNGTVISQALDEGDALPDTTIATAVNSGGAIAGMGEYVVEVLDLEGGSSYWPLYQGMYWSSADATPIRLDTPLGYHTCLPTAMNDDGVIVGVAYQLAAGPDYTAEATAVAWRVVDGEVWDVTTLGPLDSDDTSFAQGVNNTVEGVCLIVGHSLLGRRTDDGFLRQWIKFAFPNRLQSFSTAVTWAVTLEEDGTLSVSDPKKIDTPGDGRYSFGFGINDLGEACGVATEGGVYLDTYLGYADDQPLAELPDTYFINNSVHDINLAGESVGYLQERTSSGYIDAVIWVGGSPTKLYSFIGKGKSTFSRFYMAYKINTRGDIVGYGWTKSGSHAFLMIRK